MEVSCPLKEAIQLLSKGVEEWPDYQVVVQGLPRRGEIQEGRRLQRAQAEVRPRSREAKKRREEDRHCYPWTARRKAWQKEVNYRLKEAGTHRPRPVAKLHWRPVAKKYRHQSARHLNREGHWNWPWVVEPSPYWTEEEGSWNLD